MIYYIKGQTPLPNIQLYIKYGTRDQTLLKILLYIKTEMDDIAVFNFIFFAF